MTDCLNIFKQLLDIGNLQIEPWYDNQLIHLQNSDDVAVKDFVIGKIFIEKGAQSLKNPSLK